MKHYEMLQYGCYYHIYNRGINGENIFVENGNFQHFMRLYAEHISPIADTFAWVLMKNHFHLLVRIFNEEEIAYIKPKEEHRKAFYTERKKYNPSQQFGNLFNAYTKAFNNRYNRSGSLFESPFSRKMVGEANYFKHLVFYIHFNPVHHGFCNTMTEYPWSSYLSIISIKPTQLKRDRVIGWFNSSSDFIEFHHLVHDFKIIESLIME